MSMSIAPQEVTVERVHREREYLELVLRVRELVESSVPEGAIVAVVSRGDSELLQIAGRTGWHFPRAASGAYAGHHPAGDEDAIARLEAVRGEGAGFVVFPATSFWWLDYYVGLRSHLDNRYRRVAEVPTTAVIYSLSEIERSRGPVGGRDIDATLIQLRSVVGGLLPTGTRVLVATRGDERLLDLGGPVGCHFPQNAYGRHASDPVDGGAVIANLDSLRQSGAEFLVIPRSADWWLDRYPDFRNYIRSRFPLVTRQEHICTIYDLATSIKVKAHYLRSSRRTNV